MNAAITITPPSTAPGTALITFSGGRADPAVMANVMLQGQRFVESFNPSLKAQIVRVEVQNAARGSTELEYQLTVR